MNTSYPTHKTSVPFFASSFVREAATPLVTLLVAGIVIVFTQSNFAAALALGPARLASQALVGLGVGATLAGAMTLVVFATSWGQAEQTNLASRFPAWVDLLVGGLLAGGCTVALFQIALQSVIGPMAAAALFALVEARLGGFRLFGGGRLANSMIALGLGLVTAWLYQQLGLAAALAVQIGFRIIFLALVRPALSENAL